MTAGDIMKIGETIGLDYVDEMTNRMVKSMLDARIRQIKKRLKDDSYKCSHKKMKKSLEILSNPNVENQPFYQSLFNETRNKLMISFRQTAENTNINLINAEYFDFSGRIR